MAHKDWKRYYCVVYDKPPPYQPFIFRDRQGALDMLASERRACAAMPYKPVGIARLRGRKHKPKLQTYFNDNAWPRY